jgi:hypothetical protein
VTTFLAQTHAARRRALEELFAATVARDADRLRAEFVDASRKAVPGSVVLLVGLLVAGLTLLWPLPGATPLLIVRGAAAAAVLAACVWISAKLAGAPAGQRMAAELQLRRHLLPRWIRELRPGAKYKPDAALDREWMRRSALLSGADVYQCRHLVSWTSGERRRQFAQVNARGRARTVAPVSDELVDMLHGLVAIADTGAVVPGHVIVASTEGRLARHLASTGIPQCDEAALAVLGPWRPAPAYQVHASSAEALRQALSPDVVALLNLLLPTWTLDVAAAQGELFVAIEQASPWFTRAGGRLQAADFVELGEVMDVVDALAAGVGASHASVLTS